MKPGALERLLAPLTPEDFVARYWMQRSVHIPGSLDKVAGVFTIDAFHTAVANAARRADAPRLGFDVRAGAMRAIAPTAIDAELAAGNTICVSGIDVGDRRLAELAAELKRELAFPGRVAVNAYLSPRGTGFSFVHFDARIATTLQIAGRKRWRYAEAASLPWPAHNVRIAPDGQLDWHRPPSPWEERAGLPGTFELAEVVLEPGHVLCLPAGTFHAAEAVDDISLSININFNYGGFFELILPHLRETLAPLPQWREPPPAVLGSASMPEPPPANVAFAAARIADLHRALDALDPAVIAGARRRGNGVRAADAARPELARADAPAAWLADRARAYRYEVTRAPLDALPRWRLGDELAHDTRRFFTVEGIAVETNFGRVPRWTQPIINQPEIGILGFLARRVGGELQLLGQAKMEPGNRVMVQLSPTVQATPSNYTRVHGGRATPFLDRFVGDARGRVLVDTLQSEQGSRYLRKRNRNMVVEVTDEIELTDDFRWLTLHEIRGLLAAGCAINMNARTVLSCLPYDPSGEPPTSDAFRRAVIASHMRADDDELAATLAWLADRKTELAIDVRRIRLSDLEHWICDRESIRHTSGNFFRVIGVSIAAAEGREVGAWTQPMVEPVHPGTIAFVCQRRAGCLEFLVQARAEPGFIDRVELGATLQLSPGNYASPAALPPFADLLACPPEWVRFRAAQSDDGGRFYHDDTMHLVIEVPENEPLEAPPNFRWVSLGLLKRLLRRGYLVDIEARSLLTCLG